MATPVKRLDLKALQERDGGTISTKEALKDITPFQWKNSVLNGKSKITVKRTKDNNV